MSKLFFLVLIICVTFVACKKKKADTERQPGYCLNKKHSIKEGEFLPARIGKCKAVKCIDAAENTVKTINCPTKEPGKKCVKLEDGDKSLQYPACCPKMKCDPKNNAN